MTPSEYVTLMIGKIIDYDKAYGAQCVDAKKDCDSRMGVPVVACPNNWAESYWTCLDGKGHEVSSVKKWQDTYHIKITDPSKFKDGDWVIWKRGSKSHPLSHIAMYYQGKAFGENQGGNGGYTLKATDFTDAAGALRYKKWAGEQLPYGYSKLIRSGIEAHVYRGNKAAGYSLHVLSADGENALKDITEFDTNEVVKTAVVNAGYFQMQEGQADPVGRHYGVEQDAAAGNTYTQAPKQSGILAFYEDKQGNCEYCTGDQYFGKADEVNFAITPYAVRIHEGKKVFGRSVNYGDKDDEKNEQTAAVKFDNGDWAVAVFPGKICPRDTVTFFDHFTGVQELILMDSGGSSQMLAWNNAKKAMEKKLYTKRELPNVLIIAKIEKTEKEPVAEDLEPVEEPIIIPETPEESDVQPEEPVKEEEPMEKENAEITPVQEWKDPEPETNIIAERIASLLSVKSILTIALTFIFGYLVMNQLEVPEFFTDIYKIVILFFFGYQTGKASKG